MFVFPSHLLHDRVSDAVTYANEHEQRLKSRRPFSRHAAHLVANNYDPPKAWNDRIDAGPPFIRSACPPPSPSLPPGADLPRKQWVRLNRLRSGTARVGETLQLWGMQEAASCPCGHPTQTVEHVVTDCVLLKSPGDLTALCCPNAETRSWLSELPIELWTLIFDYLVVVWQTLIYYIVFVHIVSNLLKMASKQQKCSFTTGVIPTKPTLPIYLDHMLRVVVPQSSLPHQPIRDTVQVPPAMAATAMPNPTHVAFDTTYHDMVPDDRDPVLALEGRREGVAKERGSTLISKTWSGSEVPSAKDGRIGTYGQRKGRASIVVMGNPSLPEKMKLHGKVEYIPYNICSSKLYSNTILLMQNTCNVINTG